MWGTLDPAKCLPQVTFNSPRTLYCSAEKAEAPGRCWDAENKRLLEPRADSWGAGGDTSWAPSNTKQWDFWVVKTKYGQNVSLALWSGQGFDLPSWVPSTPISPDFHYQLHQTSVSHYCNRNELNPSTPRFSLHCHHTTVRVAGAPRWVHSFPTSEQEPQGARHRSITCHSITSCTRCRRNAQHFGYTVRKAGDDLGPNLLILLTSLNRWDWYACEMDVRGEANKPQSVHLYPLVLN